MTYWQLAMILCWPLCLDGVRLRTWAAIFVSGLAGHFVSAFYVAPVLPFLAIDILTALVILARPKGTAQCYIGSVYMAMIVFHLAFIVAGRPDAAVPSYYNMMHVAGWASLAILFCWGAGDAGKRIGARLGLHWPDFHRAKVGGK